MAEAQNPETGPLVADDDVAPEQAIEDSDSALDLVSCHPEEAQAPLLTGRVAKGGASDTTSMKSSILKYRHENGRTYHAYKDGSYVLPNDELENERLDLQHHLFLLTFDGKLHAAPLDKPIRRAFDAGCGTGIWTMDFADEHPECEVVGVDLSPIQPRFVAPNVAFYVDDLEDSWNFSAKFDFVFARFLTGSILDWPKFFRQSFQFLNPGGTIELLDIVYPLQSDDGTLAEDSPLFKWSKMLLDAFTANSRALDSTLKYAEQLAEAGFVDITVVKRKWPTNRWPKDSKHKQIGMWAYENTAQALSALSLAVFTRPLGAGGLGWSAEELEVLLAGVRRDLKDLSIHSYWRIWSVYAKKPE